MHGSSPSSPLARGVAPLPAPTRGERQPPTEPSGVSKKGRKKPRPDGGRKLGPKQFSLGRSSLWFCQMRGVPRHSATLAHCRACRAPRTLPEPPAAQATAPETPKGPPPPVAVPEASFGT
eukprot:6060479-Alexandrium_andersonii.AAC.1